MTNSRTVLLRRRHGGMKARFCERIHQLKETIRVMMRFCPTEVRVAALPLVLGTKIPEPEVEPKPDPETMDAARFRADLRTRRFFGRVVWAVKYIFCGIGGDE